MSTKPVITFVRIRQTARSFEHTGRARGKNSYFDKLNKDRCNMYPHTTTTLHIFPLSTNYDDSLPKHVASGVSCICRTVQECNASSICPDRINLLSMRLFLLSFTCPFPPLIVSHFHLFPLSLLHFLRFLSTDWPICIPVFPLFIITHQLHSFSQKLHETYHATISVMRIFILHAFRVFNAPRY